MIADIDATKAQQAAQSIAGQGSAAMALRVYVFAETKHRFGTVDILVNNAGILHSTALEEITEDEWDKIFAVNMKGTFLCCRQKIKEWDASAKRKAEKLLI